MRHVAEMQSAHLWDTCLPQKDDVMVLLCEGAIDRVIVDLEPNALNLSNVLSGIDKHHSS